MKLGLLALLIPFALWQQPKPSQLKPANATHPFEFGELMSVRELSDGRVLVVDRYEQSIVIADFATKKTAPVGRKGDGPGEYGVVMELHALSGDTTLMANGMEHRWILFDGVKPAGTLPPTSPVAMNVFWPYGADARGHTLGVVQDGPLRSPTGVRLVQDSAYLVLWALRGDRSDTVGKIFSGRDPAFERRGESGGYGVFEKFILARDGWIAVVRIKPYRIDWRSPEGKWTRGAPIVDPIVKMDDREKKAYLDMLANRTPTRRLRGSGTMGDPGTQPPEIKFWPATVPSYSAGFPLLLTLDGRVLVRRTPTAAYPAPMYDVLNRQGAREKQILVNKNQYIVGFGKNAVYVSTTDDEGVQKLSRHPWP